MSNTYSESEWRCPTDGAFHVLDFADLQRMHEAPCIRCGKWVDIMLVNDGMANFVNAPPVPVALPLPDIGDVDAFNGALKSWLLNTYENGIGEVIHSVDGVQNLLGLPLKEIRPVPPGCSLPRIPNGLTQAEALVWCQNLIRENLPDVGVRYFVRHYPTVVHCVMVDDPSWGTKAGEFYNIRFRIFVVEEKP